MLTNAGGVIFDMDGVLVDSYRAHLQSWQQTVSKYGLSLAEADFARGFGRTAREFILQMWPGRFDEAQAREFDLAKEASYRDILASDFPEMDGAGDLIQSLHDAGFKIAIGSSGPPENVALAWRKVGHGDLISAAVDGSQVKFGKPDPGVFLLAASKLGLSPGRCVVIEDALVGIEAARRAKMKVIALVGTTTRQALSHADQVVDSLREVTPEMVWKLIGKGAESDGKKEII